MSESIYIALQVYGLGFVIAMGMALMIKVMLYLIRHFTKKKTPKIN